MSDTHTVIRERPDDTIVERAPDPTPPSQPWSGGVFTPAVGPVRVAADGSVTVHDTSPAGATIETDAEGNVTVRVPG